MTLPFIPVPNTLEVTATYTRDNQLCQNVYHVTGTSPYTDITALMARMIGVWEGWETTWGRARRHNNTTLTQLSVKDIGQQDGPFQVKTEAIVGTQAGSALPNSVTLAIKWATARSGRSFRGRTYHIGLSETTVGINNVTPAEVTALQTAYANLITAVQGSFWNVAGDTAASLSVASRYHGKAARLVGVSTPIVAAQIVDSIVDNQRRRLPGRGK